MSPMSKDGGVFVRKKQAVFWLGAWICAALLLSSCGNTAASSFGEMSAAFDRMDTLSSYTLTAQILFSNDPQYFAGALSEGESDGYDTGLWSFEEAYEQEDGAPRYRSHVEGEVTHRKTSEEQSPLWRTASAYQLCYTDGFAGMQGEYTQIDRESGEEDHHKIPPHKQEVSFAGFLQKNSVQSWFPSFINEAAFANGKVDRPGDGQLCYRATIPGAKLSVPLLDRSTNIRVEEAKLEIHLKDGYVVEKAVDYTCTAQGKPCLIRVSASYADLNVPVRLLLPNLNGYSLDQEPTGAVALW